LQFAFLNKKGYPEFMLSQEALIKSLKLQESIRKLGGMTSEGSCFGTPLPDRLRPPFETVLFKRKEEKSDSKNATPTKPPEEFIDRPF